MRIYTRHSMPVAVGGQHLGVWFSPTILALGIKLGLFRLGRKPFNLLSPLLAL